MVSVGLLLGGCTGASQQIAMPLDEWERYRRYRLAPTEEAKLEAGWAYLKQRPKGRFYQAVRRDFDARDERYLKRADNDRPRLRRYLRALPTGPRVGRARRRLEALDFAARAALQKERDFSRYTRGLEQRLADAARMRKEFLREYLHWVQRLVEFSKWGAPLDAVAAGLGESWDASLARCRQTQCLRLFSLPYAIPDGKRLQERRAIFDVTFTAIEGDVVRAKLSGPELFSRLGEVIALRPVRGGMARAEAIASVVEYTAPMLEQRLPTATCTLEAVAPVLLHRQCRGLRVRIVAAAEPGQDDLVEVVALPKSTVGAPPAEAAPEATDHAD